MRTCAEDRRQGLAAAVGRPAPAPGLDLGAGRGRRRLVSVNTARANQIVAEALAAGVDRRAGRRRRGPARGRGRRQPHRLPARARRARRTWVEVKCATMDGGDGGAAFPDSVTTRGARHLGELARLRAGGDRAVLLFCVARAGARRVRPADEIDPTYGDGAPPGRPPPGSRSSPTAPRSTAAASRSPTGSTSTSAEAGAAPPPAARYIGAHGPPQDRPDRSPGPAPARARAVAGRAGRAGDPAAHRRHDRDDARRRGRRPGRDPGLRAGAHRGDRGLRRQPALPVQARDPADHPGQPGADPDRRRDLRQLRGLPVGAQPARPGPPLGQPSGSRAWDRHGHPIDEVVHGLKAGTFQHEVDHLDGTLFVDRVTDPTSLSTWTEFERHHRAAFVEEVTALVARVGS